MLARLYRKYEDKEEGFTLIELLVVIIIIGILAAIAIPVFLSQKKKGYEASEKSDLRNVAQAVESYNVDNQNYAQTVFGTGTLTDGTSKVTGSAQTIGADKLNMSNGNTITWIGGKTVGTAFCLKATSTKTATVWWYSSDKGGLLPDATPAPCSSASP